jgi:threonine dehydrogenase-like Zn-dependent dehydrogenase
MRALTFRGIKDHPVGSVPEPKIEAPGDAVVRVERAGLCGSDPPRLPRPRNAASIQAP